MLAVQQPGSWPQIWSTAAETDVQSRLSMLPFYAPTHGGLGAVYPQKRRPSWPRILSTEAEQEIRERITEIPFYVPAPRSGFGAVSMQPPSWPRAWSTEGELDVQSRLARLPFYTAPIPAGRVAPAYGYGNGLGGAAEDLQAIIQKAPALLSKIVVIINKAGPHLDTIIKVVEDPALPQLVDRIKTMQAIQAQKAAKQVAPAPGALAPTAPSGVGLRRVLPLWDVAIYYEKHPYMPWLIAGGAVLVLGVIGFAIGRWTKRGRAAPMDGFRRYYRRR